MLNLKKDLELKTELHLYKYYFLCEKVLHSVKTVKKNGPIGLDINITNLKYTKRTQSQTQIIDETETSAKI